MAHFVHDANIVHFRKLIAASELDPARDERRHATLLILLAAELAKDKPTCGPQAVYP
jgi:hypothetical protein